MCTSWHGPANAGRIGTLACPASIQSVLLPFVEQGLAADAQNLGALADLVVRRIERGANGVAFDLFERTQRDSEAGISDLHGLRKIFRGERRGGREDTR